MNNRRVGAKTLSAIALSCAIMSTATERPHAQDSASSVPSPAQSATHSAGTASNLQSSSNDSSKSSSVAPNITSIDVKPGDHWNYKIYDDIVGNLKGTTTFVVTELQGETYSVQASFVPSSSSVAQGSSLDVFDRSWNIIEDPVWKRDPFDPTTGVKFPLTVGAHWNTKFVTERQNPSLRFSGEATSKVAAWEHVKLRFGLEYDTFRIETALRFKSAGSGKNFDQKVTLWYAPQVNRYVKRIIENQQDGRLSSRVVEYLAEYGRRNDD